MTDQEEAAEFCAKYLPESDEVYRALVGASKKEIRELTRVLNESGAYSTTSVKDVLLDIITLFRVRNYLMAMNTSVLPAVGSSREPLREDTNQSPPKPKRKVKKWHALIKVVNGSYGLSQEYYSSLGEAQAHYATIWRQAIRLIPETEQEFDE